MYGARRTKAPSFESYYVRANYSFSLNNVVLGTDLRDLITFPYHSGGGSPNYQLQFFYSIYMEARCGAYWVVVHRSPSVRTPLKWLIQGDLLAKD